MSADPKESLPRISPPRVKSQHDPTAPKNASKQDYKGFVAGVFSGIGKLSVGHPTELIATSFDTIKVRLQTSDHSRFKGPLDCTLQTLRKEGIRGFYKGATPPLIGWMFMDSVLMGSLTFYRRILREHVFNRKTKSDAKLPAVGHGIAGIFAGWTVSTIAAPVEHIKARLQIQYAAEKSKRIYSGPVDCAKKIFVNHGVRGLYKGFFATTLFRSFFFFWWGSYDIISAALTKHTNLSTPSVNFWAGGLSAQIFWITSYPSDVVKQRIMTDGLGADRRFPRWKDATVTVWRESGWRGFWRGFVPCFLRAFPANAVALVLFEGVMRSLP